MRGQTHTLDQAIARIASAEHGVIDREELLEIGLSRAAIDRRLAKGSLLREFPGVYRVGHRAPSVEARYLAAVKACGPGAVLSGKAAAHLLGLLKGPLPMPEVITTRQCSIRGIKTKRARGIDPRDVTMFRKIRITTVQRTIVEVASVLDEEELARVCHEAWVRYRVGPRQLDAVLARRPTSAGARKLRRVLHDDGAVVLSKLEKRFLQLLREVGLPLPQTNKVASGRYVDCRWPGFRLTVELDSYRFHNSRHSWQQGYQREREAYARRDRYRRYTWHDVFEDPSQMLAELRELLAQPLAA